MRIVIVGHGAAGKDYLKRKLESKGYRPSVSYTSRPPRPGEVEGREYHFISEQEFKTMIEANAFYEWNVFAGKWYYGTPKASFGPFGAEVFVMTPSGVEKLSHAHRIESIVFFLDVPEKIRRERLMERNDSDNVDRRITTDNEDFGNFKNYDVRITDFSVS